ncbi:MAG: hypothetical protein IPH33_12690 [Bacteroidetes bacterium]|nr:hypothetical protein [Bacteroidota bacterium]
MISDTSGVNTVGTGIGHDMSAELDNKTDRRYPLNDYYENDLNSYQKGKLFLSLKVCQAAYAPYFKSMDVYNNSMKQRQSSLQVKVNIGIGSCFESSESLYYAYNFHLFEHNRPFVPMDVKFKIFTVAGS